ncbi:hypothetical protein CEXT_513351 [Caerostris extrusa]|uniref:Uncharacterized protein n=1 Tax=Caerostris extrusa TaxID=172846 RepID=A0AAV4N6M6_CAEEX|nr:hypothetical protein CEXT_513351 [Caerostris extrusa]
MEQSKNTNLPSEEYLSGSPVKGNSSSEEPYEFDILSALLDYGETSDISDIESYEDVEIHKNKQVVETIHSVSKMKHSTQFVPGNKKQSDMFSFKNKNQNYSPPGNNSDIQEGTPLENDNYITPYTTKEINFSDVESDSNRIKTVNRISHHKSKVNVHVSSGIDHHLHVSKSCVKKQKLNSTFSCYVKDNINPSERNIFCKESDTYSYKRNSRQSAAVDMSAGTIFIVNSVCIPHVPQPISSPLDCFSTSRMPFSTIHSFP